MPMLLSRYGAVLPQRLRAILRRLNVLEKTFLALLLASAALWVFAPLSPVHVFVALAAFFTGAAVAIRLIVRGVKKVIWRLRNRLLVASTFLAVVPIALIVILVGLGLWILTGQIAAYLVVSELEGRSRALLEPAQGIVYAAARDRADRAGWVAPFLRQRYPGFEMLVRSGAAEWRYPANASIASPPQGWGDTSGLLLKDGAHHLWAHAVQDGAEVTMLAPLSRDFLSDLVPGLGEVSLVPREVLGEAESGRVRGPIRKPAPPQSRDHLPKPANTFDRLVYYVAPVPVSIWNSPGVTETDTFVLYTRYFAVLSKVFSTEVEWSEGVTVSFVASILFFGTAILFLVVELFALIVGVRLTQSITHAVHNIYEGTERVRVGDFSHRIEVRGSDQLADLGTSFNRMTEDLQQLVEVAKEKERLQSELEIASEVQIQLYPKTKPVAKTLQLAAACHPARMVSGDYYDYLNLNESTIALAIGDVAGKGISAALLMATVQASMRTQLRAGREMAAAAGNGSSREAISVAGLINQLNQQLYAYTPPEKFATFYFALYDDATGLLTYTNAGHPPPILLRNGEINRLDVTGTVVGAFPFSRFAESTLQLMPRDLIVCFTDGVTEPENAYGEMFGEERLIETVARNANREADEIIHAVTTSVREFTGSPELQDDMTMLVARRL